MPSFSHPSLATDLAAGNVTLATDTLYVMLVSGYTPTNAHAKRSDVTGEVTGTGYTAGGQALSGVAATSTLANAWGTAAATSTAYAVGAVVRPSSGNGYLYQCITAGTSGGSAPTWPTTIGDTVTDGTAKWRNAGTGVTVLTATNPAWTTATISATGAEVYKHRGGASSADNLVGYIDFGGTVASTGGTFTITTVATTGFLNLFA